MNIVSTNELNNNQKQQALDIWNAAYPAKLCLPDTNALDVFLISVTHQIYYLLANNTGELTGWACVFSREGMRCFFIMVSENVRGHGYGTMLLNEIKQNEEQVYGWVIDHDNDIKADGTVYPSPLNFYLKNDFMIHPTLRLETGELSAVLIEWKNQPFTQST